MTGANVTSPTGGERVTQESCWCTGIHRHESAGVREADHLHWGPRLPSGRFRELPPASRFRVIWTLRQGKVIRWETDLRPEEALEAAGLRELAMSEQNIETTRYPAIAD